MTDVIAEAEELSRYVASHGQVDSEILFTDAEDRGVARPDTAAALAYAIAEGYVSLDWDFRVHSLVVMPLVPHRTASQSVARA